MDAPFTWTQRVELELANARRAPEAAFIANFGNGLIYGLCFGKLRKIYRLRAMEYRSRGA